jgi:hypothetical protein
LLEMCLDDDASKCRVDKGCEMSSKGGGKPTCTCKSTDKGCDG